jgi:hypothetical protein
MSVWVCFPSKRPPEVVNKVLQAWHDMGYKSSVLRDAGESQGIQATVLDCIGEYRGWGASMNFLAEVQFMVDPQCDWGSSGVRRYLPRPKRTSRRNRPAV